MVAVPGIGEYNKTRNNILGFLYEWFEAKREKKKESQFVLPLGTLGNVSYYYTQEDDVDHLVLENGKEIKLQHSSSGLISVTPLIIVFDYIINGIYSKKRIKSPFEIVNIKAKLDSLDVRVKDAAESLMKKIDKSRYQWLDLKETMKTNGIKMEDLPEDLRIYLENQEKELYGVQREFNITLGYDSDYNYSKVIIEEPELNLFPNTQQELIYYMLSVLNSYERDHQLVLTTHSPYILFSLNNCMMGGLVKDNIPEKERESFASRNAWIDPKKVSIYEIHEGSLKPIQDEDGIIEDNYLNKAYKENSADYLSLLNYFDDEE